MSAARYAHRGLLVALAVIIGFVAFATLIHVGRYPSLSPTPQQTLPYTYPPPMTTPPSAPATVQPPVQPTTQVPVQPTTSPIAQPTTPSQQVTETPPPMLQVEENCTLCHNPGAPQGGTAPAGMLHRVHEKAHAPCTGCHYMGYAHHRDGKIRIVTPIQCISCHSNVVKDAFHTVHLNKTKNCILCHTLEKAYCTPDVCFKCHVKSHVMDAFHRIHYELAGLQCLDCHNDVVIVPDTKYCLKCHSTALNQRLPGATTINLHYSHVTGNIRMLGPQAKPSMYKVPERPLDCFDCHDPKEGYMTRATKYVIYGGMLKTEHPNRLCLECHGSHYTGDCIYCHWNWYAVAPMPSQK